VASWWWSRVVAAEPPAESRGGVAPAAAALATVGPWDACSSSTTKPRCATSWRSATVDGASGVGSGAVDDLGAARLGLLREVRPHAGYPGDRVRHRRHHAGGDEVGRRRCLTSRSRSARINGSNRALEKRALVAENAALRDQGAGRVRMAQLLGRSKGMQRVFELIGKIHSTRTNVLITGESGTGKELVARALHTEGSRASARFVAVNCGAIPEELMESGLFGHVKGAFTGAVADRPGLFREADGGTLFLDEIGELSLGLQVKLLRVLQEKKVKPVGGTAELDVDVRVVAATNRELEDEVARGAFRQDLY
jgi:transcriptional regulator of acetoin/glycerol metabolism